MKKKNSFKRKKEISENFLKFQTEIQLNAWNFFLNNIEDVCPGVTYWGENLSSRYIATESLETQMKKLFELAKIGKNLDESLLSEKLIEAEKTIRSYEYRMEEIKRNAHTLDWPPHTTSDLLEDKS